MRSLLSSRRALRPLAAKASLADVAAAKNAVMRSKMLQGKVMVATIAPAARVAISEAFGLDPGDVSAGQMVTLLKHVGFRFVFDVLHAADVTIVEEADELLRRLAAGDLADAPMFTSCCPGWTALVDKQFPALRSAVSTCKSPMLISGALVKRCFAPRVLRRPAEDVWVMSVMPCLKKQDEARAGTDVDMVVTTAELAEIFKQHCMVAQHQFETPFDAPFAESSGAAALFGRSGGVMTAALRYAHAVLTDGAEMPAIVFAPCAGLPEVREARVSIPVARPTHGLPAGAVLGLDVAVIVGIGAAKKYAKAVLAGDRSIARHHFVEVMACAPAGCASGGGQPAVGGNKSLLGARVALLDGLDAANAAEGAHDNRQVEELYREWLGDPGGDLAHQLLHVHRVDDATRGA